MLLSKRLLHTGVQSRECIVAAMVCDALRRVQSSRFTEARWYPGTTIPLDLDGVNSLAAKVKRALTLYTSKLQPATEESKTVAAWLARSDASGHATNGRLEFTAVEVAACSPTLLYATVTTNDGRAYVGIVPTPGAWRQLADDGARLEKFGEGAVPAAMLKLARTLDPRSLVHTLLEARRQGNANDALHRIVFCGSSVGGAIAQISCVGARRMMGHGGSSGSGQPACVCVAFGAPLWADEAVRREVDDLRWASSLLNVYLPQDVLPAAVNDQLARLASGADPELFTAAGRDDDEEFVLGKVQDLASCGTPPTACAAPRLVPVGVFTVGDLDLKRPLEVARHFDLASHHVASVSPHQVLARVQCPTWAACLQQLTQACARCRSARVTVHAVCVRRWLCHCPAPACW